jgi:hypothetical protein
MEQVGGQSLPAASHCSQSSADAAITTKDFAARGCPARGACVDSDRQAPQLHPAVG